jgi:hypothetical protein
VAVVKGVLLLLAIVLCLAGAATALYLILFDVPPQGVMGAK